MATKIDREYKVSRDKKTVPAASTLTKDPERQRGFWSFLTWPFILSEVLAAALFIGKGAAHTTDQSDDGGGHGASHSNPASDDSASAATHVGNTIDDVQDNEAAQYNGHSARPALNFDNLQFASKGIAPASNEAGERASGGGDGGGGGGGSGSGDSDSSNAADGHFPGADGSGIDVGVHADQLLGFDLRIDADGVFVGVNSSPWSNLNPDYLITDLTQGSGLGDVDLHRLLGFDVHLGSDGVFVVSDLFQTASLDAGVDLNTIGLIDDSSQLTGLPISGGGSIGDVNTALSLTDGGLSGFGLLSSIGLVPASAPSAVGGMENSASDVLSSAGLPPSSDPSFTIDELASNGDVSSGNTIDVPASAQSETDELFSGNRYTEYNMTLQSPSAGKIGGALTSDTIDHAAVSPVAVDVAPPLSHEAIVPPLKTMSDANITPEHTPTTNEELIGHGHTF